MRRSRSSKQDRMPALIGLSEALPGMASVEVDREVERRVRNGDGTAL